jgi:hypothetical protein
MPNGDTRVNFSLWAVLGAIVLLGAICVSFLHAEQKETKNKQQEVIARVVALERDYANIIKGIDKLTMVVEKVADKLESHDKETRSLDRTKKRNQIP